MMNYLRTHLGAKLFLSYLAVILIGAITLGVTTRFATPRVFDRHIATMEEFAPKPSQMGNNPGAGMGMQQRGEFATRLYTQFRDSFREALNWSALTAGLTALTVSFFLSRRVVIPVRAMTTASQRIADGHFDERVEDQGSDELGQLAESFNQMATQLEEVEERRRQLLGDVAHELRTPLTTIKGSIEALEDGVLPASPETYQLILHEAERLNHLVNDLQELSRVEARAYEMNISRIKISSLVSTMQKRLGAKFEENKITIQTKTSADLPLVLADEGRTIQILTNLLNNALQHTPMGGTITLEAVQNNQEVEFSVKDTGAGIPEEHLAHIFTRFYRVDKSRSRQGGGSGIGLTITQHLVEAQGGKIWAESEGEELGSTFTFTLPTEVKS